MTNASTTCLNDTRVSIKSNKNQKNQTGLKKINNDNYSCENQRQFTTYTYIMYLHDTCISIGKSEKSENIVKINNNSSFMNQREFTTNKTSVYLNETIVSIKSNIHQKKKKLIINNDKNLYKNQREFKTNSFKYLNDTWVLIKINNNKN